MSGTRFLFLLSNDSAYYEVRQSLFKHLSPVDLLTLSRCSKSLNALVKSSCWDINKHLLRFVDYPHQFRSMMAKSGAIISGSDVLQFLEGLRWQGSDLDVYLPKSEKLILGFIGYLVTKERYKFVPYKWQTAGTVEEIVSKTLKYGFRFKIVQPNKAGALTDADLAQTKGFYEMKNISGVFVLQRPDETTIQLISAKQHPIVSIINDFYASNIFNFYTYNRCYSLFPNLTFRSRYNLATHPLNEKLESCLLKYQDRGYKAIAGLHHDWLRSRGNHGLIRHRRIGDKFSWVMELDTSGVDTSRVLVPDYIYDYACFSIEWAQERADENGIRQPVEAHYQTACRVTKEPVLEQTWILPRESGPSSWTKEFAVRSAVFARSTARLYPQEEVRDRAQSPWGFPSSFRFRDPKPEGFKFYDDEVPIWYKEWKRGGGVMMDLDTGPGMAVTRRADYIVAGSGEDFGLPYSHWNHNI